MSGRAIALGFFDGVHLGHGALLRATQREAGRLGLTPAALSFDGWVAGKPRELLNTPEDRRDLITRLYGVREVLLLPFSESLMHMSPVAFTRMLIEEYDARCVVVGYDFTYGWERRGNASTLSEECAALGAACTVVPRVERNGEAISATGIRALVSQGDMATAVELLGHPQVLTAEVEHGYALGRTLGAPTINQHIPEYLVEPAHGVYAARAVLQDGSIWEGPANVGTRPTVSTGRTVTVETWLPGFSGNLYGQRVRTELYARLRPEHRFPDVAALQRQIREDAASVKAFFAGLDT